MEPETFLRSPLTWASSCLLQPLAVENPLPIDCEAEPLLAPFENAKLQAYFLLRADSQVTLQNAALGQYHGVCTLYSEVFETVAKKDQELWRDLWALAMCETVPGRYLTALKNIYMRRIPCMLWKVLVPVPEESVAAFKAAEANRQSTYRASIKQLVEPAKQALARALARSLQSAEAKHIAAPPSSQHAQSMAAIGVHPFAQAVPHAPMSATHLYHSVHAPPALPPPGAPQPHPAVQSLKRERPHDAAAQRAEQMRPPRRAMLQGRKST